MSFGADPALEIRITQRAEVSFCDIEGEGWQVISG